MLQLIRSASMQTKLLKPNSVANWTVGTSPKTALGAIRDTQDVYIPIIFMTNIVPHKRRLFVIHPSSQELSNNRRTHLLFRP